MYLADGVATYADELAGLGPHTTGVSCLYLKDLGQVDLAVLERIIRASYAAVSSRGCGQHQTPEGPA